MFLLSMISLFRYRFFMAIIGFLQVTKKKEICRNYLIPDDEKMFQFSLLIIIYIPEEMLLMN